MTAATDHPPALPVTRKSAQQAIGSGQVAYQPYIGSAAVRAVIVGVNSRGVVLRVQSRASTVTVDPAELRWWPAGQSVAP